MSGHFGWRGEGRDGGTAKPDAFEDARSVYEPGKKFTPAAVAAASSATAAPLPTPVVSASPGFSVKAPRPGDDPYGHGGDVDGIVERDKLTPGKTHFVHMPSRPCVRRNSRGELEEYDEPAPLGDSARIKRVRNALDANRIHMTEILECDGDDFEHFTRTGAYLYS